MQLVKRRPLRKTWALAKNQKEAKQQIESFVVWRYFTLKQVVPAIYSKLSFFNGTEFRF